ncbi:Transient receptor putative cation channel sub A member 1, partial [Desmophyllum pertusum]
MDANMNDPPPPGRPGDEELPLIPLNERVKALSKLSLQSLGSVFDDVVDAGDDDVQGDKNGEKLGNLHKASLSGDEAEVKNILSKEPDLNLLDKSGRAPLHLAILGRHVKIIEMLLEAGADASCLDESQDAPLHTAVRTGDENIVGIFLRRDDSDANIKGHGSRTALHIAADLDKVSICKILMQHGASSDCLDDNNMTPLTQAVEKGSKNAVEFFFDEGRPNMHTARSRLSVMNNILYDVDSEGSTLLHLAVNSKSPEIVQLCLHNGAIIRQPKECDGSTAFHDACAQGSLEIVKIFASKDPKICRTTLIDSQGSTPLHLAALKNHSAVVQYLLEKGASIDPRDKLRRTPLFLAAGVGGTESVQVLINRGADVTVKDVDLRSCVRVAVGHTATMEVLMQKREAFRLITAKDITGFAPVHYAAKYGYLQIIKLFMDRNRSTTSVTSHALDTALHGAARYGWREIVKELLTGRNIRSINLKNNQGKTALHFACVEGHDTVVELLLTLGATVEKDHNDRTALHIAAKRGSKRCVKCILQHHPNCINLFDKNQNTALHLAGIQDYPDVVSHLLSYPEQEILMNNKNHNVLDAAFNAEKKSVLLAIAGHERWREVLTSSNPGHIAQMQKLVIKMPEVATRFMDQCITKDGNPDGEDYKITYDFTIIQGAPKPDEDSLMVLKSMLQHRRINCLTHPVCFMVMNQKWQTFGWKSLILNLILYLLFVIPLTVITIFTRANERQLCGVNNETTPRKEYINWDVPCSLKHPVIQFLQVIVVITAISHLIKEVVQFKKQ